MGGVLSGTAESGCQVPAASSAARSSGVSVERGGAHQRVELRPRGGAGDRRGDAGLRHHPGQRHLGRRRAEPARHHVERAEDREAARVEVSRDPAAARALAEIVVRAVLAGEKPLGEAVIADDPEPLGAAEVDAAAPRARRGHRGCSPAAAPGSAAGRPRRRPRARRRAGWRRGSRRRSRGPCRRRSAWHRRRASPRRASRDPASATDRRRSPRPAAGAARPRRPRSDSAPRAPSGPAPSPSRPW